MGFFAKKIVKTYPKWKMISKKMVKFRSWKTWRSHGKGHGKSWNFKSSKEYEPCKSGCIGVIRIEFNRVRSGSHFLHKDRKPAPFKSSISTAPFAMSYMVAWEDKRRNKRIVPDPEKHGPVKIELLKGAGLRAPGNVLLSRVKEMSNFLWHKRGAKASIASIFFFVPLS